jgi:hypothetical protein
MSWEYAVEHKERWFSEGEIAEMALYLAARPTVYRRSDGVFMVESDRASRNAVIAECAQDRVTYSASAIILARNVITFGVWGFEEQNIEIAAFVALCQARWPCEFRDPDAQLLTPQSFLDQHRKRREDYRRKYLGGT